MSFQPLPSPPTAVVVPEMVPRGTTKSVFNPAADNFAQSLNPFSLYLQDFRAWVQNANQIMYDNVEGVYDATVAAGQDAANVVAQAQVLVDTAEQHVEAAVASTLAQAQSFAGQAANSADEAAASAQLAQAVSNFAGDWTNQSGAASVPLTVYYNGEYWTLLQDVANISAHEPSDTSTIWARVQAVDIVRTPVIIAPLSGATGVSPQPTLEADGYANIYGFARDYREFQVDLDTGDFSSPLWTTQVDADTAVVGDTLAFNTGHKWRCRDVAVDDTAGRWSSVAVFSTGSVSIARPTLAVEGAPDDVGETPLLETSAFSVIGGSDEHLNTDWQALDDQLEVIWESPADAANKLSIAVPSDVLQELKTYTFRARHRGKTYGVSPWHTIVATTRAEFFNDGSTLDGLTFAAMVTAGNYDPTTDTGFFGEVPASVLFTGPQIASAIGLTAGTSQHANEPWLKFFVGASANCNRNNGVPYVLYIAKKPYRYNVSWDAIHARGAVYWGAGATVDKGGITLDVGLMFGAYADPANSTNEAPLSTSGSCAANHGQGSHWNDLIYRVMSETPSCPSSDTYHGGPQVGGNWASYQNSDLIIASGNGRTTWCQETSAISGTRRVYRGDNRLSNLYWSTSSNATSSYGFRPALRLS